MQCNAPHTIRTPFLDLRADLKPEWEKRFPTPRHHPPTLLPSISLANSYEAMKRKIISKQMASSINYTFTTVVE